MEHFEPQFKLPPDWVYDSQTKCYKNLDARDTVYFSEELLCFIDLPPNQDLLKDGHTKMEMGDNFSAKEKPSNFVDKTAAMETVGKRSHTDMETGDKLRATEEPFDFADKTTASKETIPKKKERPLRLYYGNGPRLHKQLSIEYGVADKRCENCGEVGQLTCFSSSFRKWALRRVTEEEMNQTCTRCNGRGHISLNCDIPISYRFRLGKVPAPKEKKTVRCGFCGEAGHNRRSCLRAV